MSYRRGYLSSTGGFADGFTSGFGLMNDAYINKRKLDQGLKKRQGISESKMRQSWPKKCVSLMLEPQKKSGSLMRRKKRNLSVQ